MWVSKSAVKVAATGPQWSRCLETKPSTLAKACRSSLDVVEGRRCLRRASTTGMVWLERPVLCERKRDKVARLGVVLTRGTRARQANARVSICEEMQGGAEKSASSSGGRRQRSTFVSDLPDGDS